jgi:HD domain-containing protein
VPTLIATDCGPSSHRPGPASLAPDLTGRPRVRRGRRATDSQRSGEEPRRASRRPLPADRHSLPHGPSSAASAGGPTSAPADLPAPSLAPSAPARERTHWRTVLGATLLVAGTPVALVWGLRDSALVVSPLWWMLIGALASLLVSQLSCWLWERYGRSEDLLFSELMLWGYLARRRTNRRLASALALLGPIARDPRAVASMSAKQRTKLLERLVSKVETRDEYLHGHSQRVARHSWMVAKRMGLSRDEVARVRTAAALHDVGKVNTPQAILQKPQALSDLEYSVIKRHPAEGAEMTAVLEDAALTAIVRHHHERLDGSGYPDGLRGEDIPLGARIIAVADTFDAITSARPYRAARPHSEALEVLRREAGTKLDPDVVSTFCAHYKARKSITALSAVGGLPDRVLELLGGGFTSAASAAKTIAVAALIGGTAATGAAVALPPASNARGGQAERLGAGQAIGSGASRRPTQPGSSPASASAARAHAAHRRRAAGPAAGAAPARSSAALAGRANAAPGSPAAAAGAGASTAPGAEGHRTHEAHQPTPQPASGHEGGRTGGTHGKGGSGGTNGGGEGHGEPEAPHGTPEAPSKARAEEPHGTPEAPAPSRTEETHGQGEAPQGKPEETRSGSEATGSPSEQAHGVSSGNASAQQ